VERIPPAVGIFDSPTRCFVVNQEWWSHIAGMVHLLADVVSWKEADDESYFAITEILKFMQGMECMDFQLRQDPTDSCKLQQSLDGGTSWTDVFDFALCQVINPALNQTTISNTYNSTLNQFQNNVYNNYVDVNFQPREILTRRFLFQDKAVKCYTDGASVSLDLLDKGGLAEQFSGTQLSYLLPHNTHRHTFFKDQRHVIMKPFGYMNNPGADAMTSVDKSMFKPFTITLTQKQLPAVLHWDENESVNYPINFAPYLALGYADAFGAAADTTTTQIGMSFVSTLYYKDA